jgi:serine O-acetyltransferase
MSNSVVKQNARLFRQDAARWIVPEQIGVATEVTLVIALRLLARYLPLRAMAWFRIAVACRELGIRGVPGYLSRRNIRRFGLELPPSMNVAGGLYIAHPVGCVLFADRIGSNVTVVGQVTLGSRVAFTEKTGAVIGDRVYLGIGARVLGSVNIGAGARIGANAVVIDDVPPDATAVGVPARIIDGAQERRAGSA